MLQLIPLCLQQLCWAGRNLTQLCHLPVHILLHHPPKAITCAFTYKSWGPLQQQDLPLWKVCLIFVPLSLFPLFQPRCSGCLTLLSRMVAGTFPASPGAAPGNTSLEPQESHLFTLRVQRTGPRGRGLEKSTEPQSLQLSCCSVSFHVSFKEGSL